MRRGEVWIAELDAGEPVVLLSADGPAGLRAMRVVAPATAAERRGFVLLSGSEALDGPARERIVAAAGPAVAAVGIEVAIGDAGVIRVALPRNGHVFCTWSLTLTPDLLIRRVGELSATTRAELDNALRLAGEE